MLIYLAKGSLPWQGIVAPTKKAKYDKISEKKMTVPVSTLCKSLPGTCEHRRTAPAPRALGSRVAGPGWATNPRSTVFVVWPSGPCSPFTPASAGRGAGSWG